MIEDTIYYKVINKDRKHYNFQYKEYGLHVLTDKFDNDPNNSCCRGGFYFTDKEHIKDFTNYGIYIYEVTIPHDARIVKDLKGDKWRSDKIILGKYYDLMDIKTWKLFNLTNDKYWYYISQNPKLKEEFIEKYKDQLDWDCISIHRKLSEEFIEKYKDRVNWRFISLHQKLSEEFIEKYKDRVDWYRISSNQKLSKEFIEKYKDGVDWDCISLHQKLSEEFIEKYKDRVDWYWISSYQKLSEEFIEKYKDRVDWYIEKYKDRVN